MAKNAKPVEEEAGEGAPLWYMSFSDMVTQLLAFFVAMTVFSSFDDNSMKNVNGVFQYMANPSIIFTGGSKFDSIVPPGNKADSSAAGSEKPTNSNSSDEAGNNRPLLLPYVANSEVFQDCKVLNFPSDRIFWGKGVSLRDDAKQSLRILSQFLKQSSCQVIVSQSDPATSQDEHLRRAWAVINFLTREGGLSSENCGISLSPRPMLAGLPDQPTLQIVMMTRNICR
jgi:flagellar motor protein MotB